MTNLELQPRPDHYPLQSQNHANHTCRSDDEYISADAKPDKDTDHLGTESHMEPDEPLVGLLKLVEIDELFHSPDGSGWISVSNHGTTENLPLRSRRFHQWLSSRYYQTVGHPAPASCLRAALDILGAKAQFTSPCKSVHVRIAETKDGTIYLDLANEARQSIRITPQGWQLTQDSPVKFFRPRGMGALPVPIPGGSINQLRCFVNAPESEQWQLMLAWVMAAFRPQGPYPILCLHGEQGSAKSTTANVLRTLIDPARAPLRSIPRSERDLMVSAANSWVLAYDNISTLSNHLSDALCRLSTGGGFSTRELYTDSEEVIFEATRPVVLNGIPDLPARNDLLDRALIVELPPISAFHRRPEAWLWQEFHHSHPRILGALLDAVVCALCRIPHLHLTQRPRMADFAEWIMAAEPALPWKKDSFMCTYMNNRQTAAGASLESSSLATALQLFMAQKNDWTGTASELMGELEICMENHTARSQNWPQSARAFSGKLREIAPLLRAINYKFEFHRQAGTGQRLISISR